MTARVATTVQIAEFADVKTPLEIVQLEQAGGLAAHVRAVLDAARRYDALLLNGSGRWDQVAAALVARRPSGPLVVSDATWKRGGPPTERLATWTGMRLLSRSKVTFCVLSSAELELFPRTWGVAPEQVSFTPFHATLTPEQLTAPASSAGDGVFAGGDSLRDYGPLAEVARGIDARFVFATRRPDVISAALPANVEAAAVDPARFVELMRSASVVVVALDPGVERSAGQQTYLNAMALGRTVVVTDSPGVRDYVEDGVTGLIVPPGDATALAEAIRWALDPASASSVDKMRAAGRDAVHARFTRRHYAERLVRVVEDALG